MNKLVKFNKFLKLFQFQTLSVTEKICRYLRSMGEWHELVEPSSSPDECRSAVDVSLSLVLTSASAELNWWWTWWWWTRWWCKSPAADAGPRTPISCMAIKNDYSFFYLQYLLFFFKRERSSLSLSLSAPLTSLSRFKVRACFFSSQCVCLPCERALAGALGDAKCSLAAEFNPFFGTKLFLAGAGFGGTGSERCKNIDQWEAGCGAKCQLSRSLVSNG